MFKLQTVRVKIISIRHCMTPAIRKVAQSFLLYAVVRYSKNLLYKSSRQMAAAGTSTNIIPTNDFNLKQN